MSEKLRVRIGSQSSFSAKPVVRPFEYAAARGFDAFEWFPDKKKSGEGWTEEDMTQETRAFIRETARAKDIALSVHMSIQTDPLKPWACGLFTKDIGFARDIGAVLFNIHFCSSEGINAYVESISPLMELLSGSGIRLSIENTPETTPHDFNKLFAYLRGMDSPYISSVGMCLDLGHANLCNPTRNNYLRYVDLLDPGVPIIHMHMHENYGDYDSHLTIFTGPAGKDPSGIEGLLKRLKKRGFCGSIILEQWPRPPGLLDEGRNKLLEMIGNTFADGETERLEKGTSTDRALRSRHEPLLTKEGESDVVRHTREGGYPSFLKKNGFQSVTSETTAYRHLPVNDYDPAEGDFVKAVSEANQRFLSWRLRLEWIRNLLDDKKRLDTGELVYIAVYLRFIGTGEVQCAEDGGHYRPSNHARISQGIYKRLSAMSDAHNNIVIRKIYPWLPSFDSEFMRSEPLTLIRDIAHRNDIPQDLKKEIKVSLQNKLHRSAGPEDLATSELLLKKITAAGASYSQAFVGEFKRFHEELKAFFNARTLEEELSAFMKRSPEDAALVRRFVASKETAEKPEQVLKTFGLLTELRDRVSAKLNGNKTAEGHQLQLIDIGLEDFSFVLLSRLINDFVTMQDRWDLMLSALSLAVGNLLLSGLDVEECAALESELHAWTASFEKDDRDQLLRLKATTDRCRRLAESYCDKILELFPERAERLGHALGVAEREIKVFAEADIRGHPVFQLSKLASVILKKIRVLASLSPWDVIVPGRVSGRVIEAANMNSLVMPESEAVIALLENIEGDEDVPERVTGIVVAHETPVLSHMAVRARQRGVVLAACDVGDFFSGLKVLAGKMGVLDVSRDKLDLKPAGKEEVYGLGAEGQHVCASIASIDPYVGTGLLPLDRVTVATGGNKAFGARRLEELSSRDGSLFKTPEGVVIPFGVMEESLRSAPSLEKKYRQLADESARLYGDDLNEALNKLKDIVGQLQVRPDVVSAVAAKLGENERLMVRSSSNCEDSAGFSGAGVYDSVANVSHASMAEAIRTVWASLWNKSAVISRRNAGVSHGSAYMAVLIQRLLSPEYSFIMHTVNPMDSIRAEIYLEFAVGLGETLASAETPGGPYRMVFEKDTGKVSILAFSSFSIAVRPGLKGGTIRETVDYASLDFSRDKGFRDRLAARLGEIGVSVEKALGSPQDIEGLISAGAIYLVQSRPQSGLK